MSILIPEIIESVRVATQSDVNLSTLDSGTVVDGVVLAESDRIFVKSQTDPIDNGVYEIQTTGQAYRTYDVDTGRSIGGLTVVVREGTIGADTIYVCVNDTPTDIVGTHGLTFVQTAGNGVDGNVNSTESSSTNNQIVLFDGTSGTEIKKSTVTIDPNNNIGSIGYLEFAEIVSPSNPMDNSGRLYKKSNDDGLWWKPDSGGPEVDLTTIGNTSPFGTERFYAENTTTSSTSSSSWQNKLSMVQTYDGGTYKISWYYNWRGSSTSRSFFARCQLDNTTDLGYHVQEPKDSGSDQAHVVSGFINVSLSAGSHQIDIDFHSEDNQTVYIWNARVEAIRIA